MTETIIYTENPQDEILDRLAQYSFDDVLQQHVAVRTGQQLNQDAREDVASGVTQGIEYLRAATHAGLHTSPVQLYYGLVSLLRASIILMDGSCPDIFHHGMALASPVPSVVGDIELVAGGRPHGALGVYGQAFTGQSIVGTGGVQWGLSELLSAIPDLYSGYRRAYPQKDVGCIPVERLRLANNARLERISLEAVPNLLVRLQHVTGLDVNYLAPQSINGGQYLILRPKLGSNSDLTMRSLSGQRFFSVSHQKNETVNVPEVMVFFMALFILGTASRYHPRVWSRFVRGTAEQERRLVVEFLNVCARKIPNLLLNMLDQQEYIFTNHRVTEIDAREFVEVSSIDELLDRKVNEVIRQVVQGKMR